MMKRNSGMSNDRVRWLLVAAIGIGSLLSPRSSEAATAPYDTAIGHIKAAQASLNRIGSRSHLGKTPDHVVRDLVKKARLHVHVDAAFADLTSAITALSAIAASSEVEVDRVQLATTRKSLQAKLDEIRASVKGGPRDTVERFLASAAARRSPNDTSLLTAPFAQYNNALKKAENLAKALKTLRTGALAQMIATIKQRVAEYRSQYVAAQRRIRELNAEMKAAKAEDAVWENRAAAMAKSYKRYVAEIDKRNSDPKRLARLMTGLATAEKRFVAASEQRLTSEAGVERVAEKLAAVREVRLVVLAHFNWWRAWMGLSALT